jgi:hypothetical protein
MRPDHEVLKTESALSPQSTPNKKGILSGCATISSFPKRTSTSKGKSPSPPKSIPIPGQTNPERKKMNQSLQGVRTSEFADESSPKKPEVNLYKSFSKFNGTNKDEKNPILPNMLYYKNKDADKTPKALFSLLEPSSNKSGEQTRNAGN